jgi:hypothetical protein
MGAKSNASTTGKMAQDSKPMAGLEWKCPHCSYTNEEVMSRAVFGDTAEARHKPVSCAVTCIFHQVMETHLRRNNYYREAEYSNKIVVYCI